MDADTVALFHQNTKCAPGDYNEDPPIQNQSVQDMVKHTALLLMHSF